MNNDAPVPPDDTFHRIEQNNEFKRGLRSVLNRYCLENGSNTPDFILADYLIACLNAFDQTSRAREKWYGYALEIGGPTAITAADDTERK